MTTKDYQQKGMFSIFLSFFKPHRGLFFLDMVCALFVALVDHGVRIFRREHPAAVCFTWRWIRTIRYGWSTEPFDSSKNGSTTSRSFSFAMNAARVRYR